MVRGLIHIFDSCKNSFSGFCAAIREEISIRQELVLGGVQCVIPWCLRVDMSLKVLSVVLWLVLLGFELVNSAIEALADEVTLEFSSNIKRCKDMASAAVACCFFALAVVWIAIVVEALLDIRG